MGPNLFTNSHFPYITNSTTYYIKKHYKKKTKKKKKKKNFLLAQLTLFSSRSHSLSSSKRTGFLSLSLSLSLKLLLLFLWFFVCIFIYCVYIRVYVCICVCEINKVLIFVKNYGGVWRWEFVEKDLMYLPGDLNYTQDHDGPWNQRYQIFCLLNSFLFFDLTVTALNSPCVSVILTLWLVWLCYLMVVCRMKLLRNERWNFYFEN